MRPYLGPALLLATVLLGACSNPPPAAAARTSVLTGVSETAAGASMPLTLTLTHHLSDDSLTGSYRAGVSPGSLSGRIDGSEITATLTPGENCSFSFTGTLTATELTGTYEPADCPGGTGGSWRLDREQ